MQAQRNIGIVVGLLRRIEIASCKYGINTIFALTFASVMGRLSLLQVCGHYYAPDILLLSLAEKQLTFVKARRFSHRGSTRFLSCTDLVVIGYRLVSSIYDASLLWPWEL